METLILTPGRFSRALHDGDTARFSSNTVPTVYLESPVSPATGGRHRLPGPAVAARQEAPGLSQTSPARARRSSDIMTVVHRINKSSNSHAGPVCQHARGPASKLDWICNNNECVIIIIISIIT